MINTGEVYLTELPNSKSHEQSGSRPSIVVIDFPGLPIAQVVPLTTSAKLSNHQNVLKIEPDKENNLSKVSYALLFQLRAIDKKRLKKKIGQLKNEDIDRLLQSIRNMYNR